MDLRHIAVEGVPGAGKSALATVLAARLGFQLVTDDVENPFLAAFHDDMAIQAFQVQLHFLLSRYGRYDHLRDPEIYQQGVVTDFLAERDEIYVPATLSEDETALYGDIYHRLGDHSVEPDMVIFLQLSVEEAQRRCRDMEPAFIRLLSNAYREFFFSYSRAPLIVVEADHFDPSARPDELDDLMRLVEAHAARGGTAASTVYYTPFGKGT